MTRYLGVEDVIGIHHETMRRLGIDPQPLARPDNLASALARPRWAVQFEEADIVCQAARLGIGISRAQGFLDGNKRTAQRALVIFLYLNGFHITGDHLELAYMLEKLAEPIVDDHVADAELEGWLRDHVVPHRGNEALH
jgi:death-on-curing family protein